MTTIDDIREQRLLQKQAEVIGTMVRSITLFEGKKGRGKTLAAVAVGHSMGKIFDIPTVVVGTRMDLKREYYGRYTFVDEKEFINQLDSISKVSKNTPDEIVGDLIERTLKQMGVVIREAVLIFDESYKLFDSRSPSDKLVKVFGYFVAQSRHYRSTIIMTSPHRDMIDKRVRRQIDWFGRCSTNRRTNVTRVRLTGGVEAQKLVIYGPNYWPMYETENLVGFRAKSLQIGGE